MTTVTVESSLHNSTISNVVAHARILKIIIVLVHNFQNNVRNQPLLPRLINTEIKMLTLRLITTGEFRSCRDRDWTKVDLHQWVQPRLISIVSKPIKVVTVVVVIAVFDF